MNKSTRQITSSVKKKFYEEVQRLHLKGISYIDSIIYLIDDLSLTYEEVAKILDSDLKERIKEEAIRKKLLVDNRPTPGQILDLFTKKKDDFTK
jgi:hypothetical protein